MTYENDPLNEADWDRLVDGEMDSAEYRRLLVKLDDRPDCWRRLALAFLEAQAFEREMRSLQRDTEPRSQPARLAKPAATRWVSVCVTAAACFLLAFWLGMLWNSNWFQSDHDDRPADRGPQMARGTKLKLPNRPDDSLWGSMTVVWDRTDGPAEEFELPIFRWSDTTSKERLLADSLQVPAELRQALERAGYQVRRDIRWTPLDIDDGSRVFVPLGEVEITPVVNRAY